MTAPVIYIGFSTVDRPQPPWTPEDAELVKSDLLNTFRTRRGERVMLPEYGTVIYDLLMDPFDEATRNAILEDVRRIIRDEPRVELTQLDVGEIDQAIRVEAQLLFRPQNSVELLVIEYDRRNREVR